MTTTSLVLEKWFISCSVGAVLHNTTVKLTSRKRLATEDNRMLHMADLRCARDLWKSRILSLHLKSGFHNKLVFLDFHQNALFSANLTLSAASNEVHSKLLVSLLVFPGQAAFRREVQRLDARLRIERSEFEPWPGTLVCSWARHSTLTTPLSTHRCSNEYRRI